MFRMSHWLVFLIMGFTACAEKPPVKLAHGADRNLFKKSDLTDGPYKQNLLAEPSSQLALASELGEGDQVDFLIEEKKLHVYKVKNKTRTPYLVYEIKEHVDLVQEKDKEGRATQFLVASTDENPDWTKRAFIEVNPANFKKVQIAYGEDRNLFSKSLFSSEPQDPKRVTGPLSRLLATAINDGVELVAFDVGQSILNVYKVVNGKKVPYLQFKIEDHYDLRQEKDEEGNLKTFLKKDNTTEKRWEKRLYIEVDPFLVNSIDVERERSQVDQHLFKVSNLESKEFKFNVDDIPSLDAKLTDKIAIEYGLKNGDVLLSQLTRDHLILKTTTIPEKIIAEFPVVYVDLKSDRNNLGEDTHKQTLDFGKRDWNEREFVMILPDSGKVNDDDSKLLEKEALIGCHTSETNPIASIAIPEGETFCYDLSKSFLSVYRNSKSLDNLISTYRVKSHLDLQGRDDASDLPDTWDKRKYVVVAVSDPEPVKNLVGDNALDKGVFSKKYIYVTTIEKSHSEAGGRLIPGMRNVLDGFIEFEFTPETITAYKTKENLNANTRTPVLRYSAQHFTVERLKNGFGDPLATIAETSLREWSDETHTRVGFERNQIPGFFNEYFGLEKNYFRRHLMSQSRMIGEIEVASDGMISYRTEEVLTPDAASGNFGEGETELEPKSVIMRHTFMPVADSTYEAKTYTSSDFSKFGFFRTTEYKLDENGRPTDQALVSYANRFDLRDGKQIVYTVNKEFPEKYKDIAEKAVAEWNKAFQAATGRTDDVVVLKENSGEDYTDPRVNMIAFIPDRIITGILGFGPMIQNPETGEIISSQTYMYEAVFKSVRNHLENIYDYIQGNLAAKSTASLSPESVAAISRQVMTGMTPSVWDASERMSSIEQKWITDSAENAVITAKGSSASSLEESFKALQSNGVRHLTSQLPDSLYQDFETSFAHSNTLRKAPTKIQPHCFYEADNQLASAIKYIRLHPDLSKEEVLNSLERQSIYTTLLHELGHNFGLRHNFQGSFDEANFGAEYQKLKEEVAQGGEETSERFLEMWKSSTVMDYISTFEEQFTGLGAYDKAAILYGYGEKVELKSAPAEGSEPNADGYHVTDLSEIDAIVAQVQEANPGADEAAVRAFVNSRLGVRSYMFCTDDHVADEPTCNRHDSGLTVEEIVDSWIADYELNYLLYATRNDRRGFTGSSSFVLSRYFLPIRQTFDEFVYKLVTDSFPSEDGPGGRVDYINAMVKGMDFFSKVIQTSEPGRFELDEETQVFKPLAEGAEATGKVLVVNPGMGKELMAEFGNVNGIESAVKRGHLFDKLAAMMVLTLRGFPAAKYDRANLNVNFYDFEFFRDQLFGTFSNLMQGQVVDTKKAVFIPSANAYLAVPDEVIAQIPEGMEVIDARVEASSNNIVEEYSMIFAVSDFNNDSDRTFADYVDFRIAGVDDQSIPSTVEKLRFLGVSGTKEYVVPQTVDKRSIAYAIAEKAPEISKEYHEAVSFLNDPNLQADLDKALEAAFEPVITEFAKTWEKIQGEELSQRIRDILEGDKEQGLERMLSITEDIVTNLTAALAQAVEAEDQAQIDEITEQLQFVIERQEISQKVSADFTALKTEKDAKETASFSLKSDLIEIESRLLKVKNYYGILN